MLQKKAEDWDNDTVELQDAGEENDRKAGAARLLGDLLERKFGPLPQEIQERLAAADFPRLMEWTDRSLETASLDEVFAE